MRLVRILLAFENNTGRTDGPTEGPMDGRTDLRKDLSYGRTDTTSYGDAMAHLKTRHLGLLPLFHVCLPRLTFNLVVSVGRPGEIGFEMSSFLLEIRLQNRCKQSISLFIS